MSKSGDGNTQDLRARPELDSPSLDSDNPFTGEHPANKDPCVSGHGSQTDFNLEVTNPAGSTVLSYDWSDISSICPKGYDPNQITRLIVQILKNHFSDPDNIFYPNLKQYVYTNDANTGIRIVLNSNWDANQTGKKPAIIIKRGEQKNIRAVIGDKGELLDPTQGETSYVRFFEGSHLVYCVGNVDGETEDLAQEVFSTFTCLSPILRSALPLHDFQVVSLGELGFLEDIGQTMAIPITVTYAYEYGWVVRTIAPPLRGVRLQASVTLTSNVS
jgi:hypothetical protein